MAKFTTFTDYAPLRALEDSADLLWGSRYQDYCARNAEDFLACIICGKRTSPKGMSMGVFISGGGGLIVHPDDYAVFPHDGGDMGWFPVGSSCISAVPAEFRAPNPYDDPVRGVSRELGVG